MFGFMCIVTALTLNFHLDPTLGYSQYRSEAKNYVSTSWSSLSSRASNFTNNHLPLNSERNFIRANNLANHLPPRSASDDSKAYEIIRKRITYVAEHFFKYSPKKYLNLLQKDGKFIDRDYSKGADLNEIRKHTQRLTAIIFHEEKRFGNVSEAVIKSFEFLAYGIPRVQSHNWWYHIIGVPTPMWAAIFKVSPYIPEEVKYDLLQRYFSDTREGPVWNINQKNGRHSGGNLGPRMFFGLVEYFLKDSLAEFIPQLKDVLHREVVLREPWDGNGMRADGCLHQHNTHIKRKTKDGSFQKILLSQVYNNNYGKEFLKYAPIVMWVLDGTIYDLGHEIEEGIFASFLECQQWLHRFKVVEPSTVGRFIDSGHIITRYGGKDAFERPIKFLFKVDRHRPEINAALHRYYSDQHEETKSLNGNKHFFVSDLMAHQRDHYTASLRLLSRRTCRPETIPSRNRYEGNGKGYFKGDGFLTVLVTGKELGSFRKEIFQVYDWAKIPGVTLQYTLNSPQVSTYSASKKHSYNDADFVGGVSNGMEGMASMIYSRITVNVTAKKSWFFFDDVILCMGSNITLSTSEAGTAYPVITTMNQLLFSGHFTVGLKDRRNKHEIVTSVTPKMIKLLPLDSWVHHDSMGYVPLVHDGRFVLEVNTGFIKGQRNNPLSSFSLWLDHGKAPVNAKYAYAIVPGENLEKTDYFYQHPTAQILRLSNSLHAACHLPKNVLGATFFEESCLAAIENCVDSKISEICSNKPILVIIKRQVFDEIDQSTCSNGIQALKENNFMGESQEGNGDDDLQTETLNLKANFKGYLRHSFINFINDIFIQLDPVLVVSVADPTQKLKSVILNIKIGVSFHMFTVVLPSGRVAGKSITSCYLLRTKNKSP